MTTQDNHVAALREAIQVAAQYSLCMSAEDAAIVEAANKVALSQPPAPEQARVEAVKPWRKRLEETAARTAQGHLHTSVEEIQDAMQAEIDDLRARLAATPAAEPVGEAVPKYCFYCRTNTHNDSECWSTRPVDWKPHVTESVAAAMLSASPAAPVAAKPDPLDVPSERVYANADELFDALGLASNPEQQAQAGEPRIVGYVYSEHGCKSKFGRIDADIPNGTPLITLQSHREAMQEKALQYVALFGQLQEAHEAIAKKDAALLACVGFLRKLPTKYGYDEGITVVLMNAEEAMK